ncbi:MAG: hypothetical protein RJB26_1676 [Pseudomonadota bacterium]|jgi:hypothetical protein
MNARPRWLAPDLWFWAAVLAGVSYCAPAWFGWHGPSIVAWKGAGVGLLAAFAATVVASPNARWLAAIMACGAMGDVVLDAVSMQAGAAWFALGHLLSIRLYWRNRRSAVEASQLARFLQAWPFWLGVPAALAITALLAHGDPRAGVAIGYTLLVALMAAFAWHSRFPHRLVGLGAFLFLVSDLLIFTRTAGPAPLREVAGLLVWPLYFGGQALIARGVVRGPSR